jgi:four helix bundle protein
MPGSRFKALVARVLAQQLLRSGTSVGANVQEAQAGQSRADFISKYSIALKEARETLYWLRLLDASGELSNGSCEVLLREADEIARVIASIIVSTKQGRS